jgi:hypothetical protein
VGVFCEAFTQVQQGGIGTGFGHIDHHAESIAGQHKGDLLPMNMGFADFPAGHKGWIAHIKAQSIREDGQSQSGVQALGCVPRFQNDDVHQVGQGELPQQIRQGVDPG